MKKLAVITFLLVGLSSWAQLTLKRADKYFDELSYAKAVELYQAFLLKNDDAYAQIKLAQSYKHLNDPIHTERWYKEVMHRDDLEAFHYLNYAQALSSNGKYEEALKYFNIYKQKEGNENLAKSKVYGIERIKDFYRDSSLISIKEVNFNSPESDFAPAMDAEGNVVFASSRGKSCGVKRTSAWNNKSFLDLYVANKESSEASRFSSQINSKFHEGAVSFSPDGNTIYFTRSNFVKGNFKKDKKGVNRIKIYSATRSGEKWGNIQEFKYNSDEYSTGDPFISSDGNTMYFVSDMQGSLGGLDIYKSQKSGEQWGEPINLGSEVNTAAHERTPYLSSNGNFYFASEGHFGLGGLDSYVAQVSGSKISDVRNIGYPINSARDDFALSIDKAGNGYLSSNRLGGTGEDDIYSFNLKEEPRVIVKGTAFVRREDQTSKDKLTLALPVISVINKTTGEALPNANSDDNGNFELALKTGSVYEVKATRDTLEGASKVIDLSNKATRKYAPIELLLVRKLPNPVKVPFEGKVINDQTKSGLSNAGIYLLNTKNNQLQFFKTDVNGNWKSNLEPNTEYVVKGTYPGYFAICSNFITPAASREVHKLNSEFILEKIELSKTIEIENLYYDVSKSDIRPDAAIELNKMVRFMNDNPTITVELGSHTDARGSDAYNKSLSGKRAKSARDYIVSQGVGADRITFRGYGETQIINRCKNGVKCSSEEHQVNRRTEVKITGIKDIEPTGNGEDAGALDPAKDHSSCPTVQLVKK